MLPYVNLCHSPPQKTAEWAVRDSLTGTGPVRLTAAKQRRRCPDPAAPAAAGVSCSADSESAAGVSETCRLSGSIPGRAGCRPASLSCPNQAPPSHRRCATRALAQTPFLAQLHWAPYPVVYGRGLSLYLKSL